MRERDVNGVWGVRSLLAAVAVGAAMSGPAVAQAQETKTEEAPLLSGPKVEDSHAPGSDTRFGEGMQAPQERERPVPLRVYEQELRRLGAPDAPDGVRLTDAQAEQVRTILAEHRGALRAYYLEHREEMLRLRREAGMTDTPAPGVEPRRPGAGGAPEPAGGRGTGPGDPAGRPGDKPAPADAMEGDDAARQAARRRLAELRAKGPAEDAAIRKIWGVLDEAQRAHVEARIEEYRAEMLRRREMEKLGEQGAPAAPGELDRLPARVRERLEAMTPEERERALERMRQRREADRGGGGGARDKAPPSMDEVELPETED